VNILQNGLLVNNDLNIKITAQQPCQLFIEFCNELEPTSLEGEHQEYTKEAFVEAILEFIVGDNQVIFNFF